MPVTAAKGAKKKADDLARQIVRARGACERCGVTDGLMWCHIIRRTYAWTRTDTENAWCLCGTCHYEVDHFADSFMQLVDQTIGVRVYGALRSIASDGVGRKFDWDAEVVRLKAIWAATQENT